MHVRLFTVPYFFHKIIKSQTLIVIGCHLDFYCTSGLGFKVYSGGGGGVCVWGGRGEIRKIGQKKEKKSLPPTPLSRGGTNTHPQARVSISETKMATRKGRNLMPMILWKKGDCEQSLFVY